jgi:flagellar basal-body rod modification protein FlgD
MMDLGSLTNIGSMYGMPSATSNSVPEKKTGTAQELGRDAFLQLMIAQLKNQDPMDPVKNEAYIAQLATLSSLEQLVAIKEAVNKLADIDLTTDSNGTDTSSTSLT